MSSLTCYFRHMKNIFEEMGVEISADTKRDVDQQIHNLLGIEYKNCSSTWKEVKSKLADNRTAFISDLKKAISK